MARSRPAKRPADIWSIPPRDLWRIPPGGFARYLAPDAWRNPPPIWRNMSAPSRHHVAVRPAEIRPVAAAHTVAGAAVADLGRSARRHRGAPALAAFLLHRLGEPYTGDPVEALRARIERETGARGLAGCAIVAPARSAGGEPERAAGRPRPIADLALALVLLSKSSDTVWVARKTPLLDPATLRRRLVTRDRRFLPEGRP